MCLLWEVNFSLGVKTLGIELYGLCVHRNVKLLEVHYTRCIFKRMLSLTGVNQVRKPNLLQKESLSVSSTFIFVLHDRL